MTIRSFLSDSMYGLQVITSESEQFMETVIEYPRDRFIEYGPEDDWWLLKYGYAKRIKRPSKTVIQVGNKLYMHPATYASVKKELDKREREMDEFMYGGKTDVRQHIK